MIVKVALYKGRKTFFSGLIAWKQSRVWENRYAQYTHVELLFPDGYSFSSSEVDGGVRYKKIEYDDIGWDFINIEVTEDELMDILDFCDRKVNNLYGWWGIFLAQMLNINIKKDGTFFCSEICTMALQEISILCSISAVFVEPAEMAKRLEDLGYKIEVKNIF